MDHEIDILNREPFLDNLMQIVEKLSQQKQGITFAIDGGWGYGKTFVLQKFKKRIEAEKKKSHVVLYYNCWEYDYYEEPLIAFTAALQDMIAAKTHIFSKKTEEAIIKASSYVRSCFWAVPSQILEHCIGVNPQKIHREAKEAAKGTVEKGRTFDHYSNLKQAIFQVQKLLQEIQKEYTLIILIDEIDRCLPPYQIKLLERFHHLFQIDNTISIFSVNRSQLEETVKQLYGGDKERVNQYLKKFMSFSLSLDTGNPNERVNEKFYDCLGLFDENFVKGGFELHKFLYNISSNMAIREWEKLWERLKLLHSLSFSRKVGYDILGYELLWLIMQGYKDFYFKRPKMIVNNTSTFLKISGAELMKPFCKGIIPSDKKDEVPCIPLYISDFFDELTTQHSSTIHAARLYELTASSPLYDYLLAYWSQLCEIQVGFVFEDDSISSNKMGKYTKNIYEQNLEDLKKFRSLSKMLLS